MRRAAKRDANEPDIVKALRDVGVQVEILNEPLDLAVCPLLGPYAKQSWFMEVKNPDGGSLTKKQIEFIARWPGRIDIVETSTEALRCVLGEEAMR